MSAFLRKADITPGGFLFLAFLVFIFDSTLLLLLFGSVFIHELGHLLMLRRCGARVRNITLSITGLCIRCDLGGLSPWEQFLCALAGPLMGALAALVASLLGNLLAAPILQLFSGVNAVLSVFNLLPAKPLDGWRMLCSAAPSGAYCVSCLTSTVILLGGLVLMYLGYGTVFAMMGVFLLLQNERPKYRMRMLEFG